MILQQQNNTPVTAPQFMDMVSALVSYRSFKNDYTLTMANFISFITQPSSDRASFLELFNASVTIRNNSYAKVIYS
jgi:hypothetical protein